MSDQILHALSPWSEVNTSEYIGINPRLDDLDGKVIGLYGDFMRAGTMMLYALKDELQKRYPNATFSYIQYPVETSRIAEDEEFLPRFKEWVDSVDCIFSFFGYVPSAALFLGYNTAFMERLGKPTVMLVMPRTLSAAQRGVKALGVPGVRILTYTAPFDGIRGHVTREGVAEKMAPDIAELTDKLVDALTRPLTEEEANPTIPQQEYARTVYSGTAREISRLFYKNGWTNGQPIEIPTQEAVDEMLRGTDLPPDYVVGYVPPKMGCATVKTIAINAVMAGCLPTYLPAVIAAVQGALDPRIYLEGWTCSQSTWGPIITLSGPIVRDIGLNTKDNALSPYYKANACIARAFGYIMMNVGGLRPAIEDLSEIGHENRLGLCLGDDPDENPWGPIHMDFGMDREDSAVTMFWPQEHRTANAGNPATALSWLCDLRVTGWEPGLQIIFTPMGAKMMADAGWTKRDIMEYLVEYARRPGSEADITWLIGNNHVPKNVPLPVNMEHSTRVYWDSKHMFCMVAGGKAGTMLTAFVGGGDHGGPSCTKIQLPKNWDALVAEYADVKPEYIEY